MLLHLLKITILLLAFLLELDHGSLQTFLGLLVLGQPVESLIGLFLGLSLSITPLL